MQEENHRTVLTEHEMVVDGVLLREYKELNHVKIEDGSDLQKQVLTHMRSIGERKYTVQQITIDGHQEDDLIETNIPDEEIQAFKDEWDDKWKPTIGNQPDAKGLRGFVKKFLKKDSD